MLMAAFLLLHPVLLPQPAVGATTRRDTGARGGDAQRIQAYPQEGTHGKRGDSGHSRSRSRCRRCRGGGGCPVCHRQARPAVGKEEERRAWPVQDQHGGVPRGEGVPGKSRTVRIVVFRCSQSIEWPYRWYIP